MDGWRVDDDLVAKVAEGLQAWAGSQVDGAEAWAYLWVGAVPISRERVGEFMAACTRKSGYLSVAFVNTGPSRVDEFGLHTLGKFTSQVVDPNAHWRDLLDLQIAKLLIDPAALDVGLIKNGYVMSRDWMNVSIDVGEDQHKTVRTPLDYEMNRHLWSEYVIDAAGVSLLTSQHLAKANDLSNWDITEVAPQRYLVKARDLAAWFEPIVPDDHVIEQARADFGDAILSWDAILANPGPLTQTDPAIIGR